MNNDQLTFDFLESVNRREIIFVLVGKNQRTEIIIKHCGSLWDLINNRMSFDGTEEYLLRSRGNKVLSYWVRLVDDSNFWIERVYGLWPVPNGLEDKQRHVDWLAEKGIYRRPPKNV